MKRIIFQGDEHQLMPCDGDLSIGEPRWVWLRARVVSGKGADLSIEVFRHGMWQAADQVRGLSPNDCQKFLEAAVRFLVSIIDASTLIGFGSQLAKVEEEEIV